ncbi:MAG: hypothetical protein M3460_13890 [Actinomycetota bacterium]|jgi:hypothetical protein|nr:hypothetical protein [Actinomycetota bacterium]
MVGSDAGMLKTLDWVVVGAGLLAYISSFFHWYTASVSVLNITRSAGATAWNAGFGAWFSVLLLVVAGGLALVSRVGGRLRLPVSTPLITLGLSTLAFVTILLRWVTFPDATDGLGEQDTFELGGAFTASSGAGPGLYLGLTAAIAAVVASFLTFRAAGSNVN